MAQEEKVEVIREILLTSANGIAGYNPVFEL